VRPGTGGPEQDRRPTTSQAPEPSLAALVLGIREQVDATADQLRSLVHDLSVEIDRSGRRLGDHLAEQRREFAAARDDFTAVHHWLDDLRSGRASLPLDGQHGRPRPGEDLTALSADLSGPVSRATSAATPGAAPGPTPGATPRPTRGPIPGTPSAVPFAVPAQRPPETDDAAALRAAAAAAARIGLPAAHTSALLNWTATDHVAIVEFDHAGGLRRVALAAIAYATTHGRQVLVVTPDRRAAEGWHREVLAHLPELVVDLAAEPVPAQPLTTPGRSPAGDAADVVITVADVLGGTGLHPAPQAALLVAQDVHRLVASPGVFDGRCPWRLGLALRGGRRPPHREPATAYFRGTVLPVA
jgi:hypothetical protein